MESLSVMVRSRKRRKVKSSRTAPHGITVHTPRLHYTAPCCNTTPCSIQRTAHRTRTHEHPHSCVPLSSAIWREGSCVSQLLTVVLIGCSMMVTSRLGPLGHHGTPGRPNLFYTAHIPRWSTGLMGTVSESGGPAQREALPGKTRHFITRQTATITRNCGCVSRRGRGLETSNRPRSAIIAARSRWRLTITLMERPQAVRYRMKVWSMALAVFLTAASM